MFGEERPYQVRTYETTLDERAGYWACGEGLQAADGLAVSPFGRELGRSYIAGQASSQEICEAVRRHYDNAHDATDGEREADIVACRITAMVERADESSFVLSARMLAGIHGALFSGVFPDSWCGRWRECNLRKGEPVLKGASVPYEDFSRISAALEYDLATERKYAYRRPPDTTDVRHMARFISDIWQIHPFREGNTRTCAVFAILYLNALGLPINNEIFRSNSLYFRDCLVRASYTSVADNVLAGDASFIEDFFCAAAFGGELQVCADNLILHGLEVAEDDLMAYRTQEDYLASECEDLSLVP